MSSTTHRHIGESSILRIYSLGDRINNRVEEPLLNNLAAAVGHARAEDLVHSAGLPGRARPEEIDLHGFLSLLTHWKRRANWT